MSLASVGCQDHPVVARGIEFLLASIRADSSWAVENERATWNTALAINNLVEDHAVSPAAALVDSAGAHGSTAHDHAWEDIAHVGDAFIETVAEDANRQPHHAASTDEARRDDPILDERCLDWLLDRQHNESSPVTEVPAGGWSWGDSPGRCPTLRPPPPFC